MKKSTQDKAKGMMHKVKGGAKEKTGELMDDEELKAEGKSEKLGGKLQKKKGETRRPFEKD